MLETRISPRSFVLTQQPWLRSVSHILRGTPSSSQASWGPGLGLQTSLWSHSLGEGLPGSLSLSMGGSAPWTATGGTGCLGYQASQVTTYQLLIFS